MPTPPSATGKCNRPSRTVAERPRALVPLAPAKRIRGTASSRKVLQVLTAFTPERPVVTVDALARSVRVPLSTAYRYIALLREVGLVTDDGRGGYHLSPRVVELARASRAAVGFLDIARPVMERLCEASGETAVLIRRVGDAAVCVERVESAQRVRLSFDVGSAFPLHRGASPKVLLASMGERERGDYLVRARRIDPALRQRGARFEQELESIVRQGWAESTEEITPDIWAVAAPVVEGDATIAALSVAGPAYRLTGRQRSRIVSLTRAAAADISAQLSALVR